MKLPRCVNCGKFLTPSKLAEDKWVCKTCNDIHTDEQVGWLVSGNS